MNFYALLKLHKSIKSPKLKLLGLGLASAVGFRHLSVRLDPTLRCNLACRMCYFSGEGYMAKAGGLIQRDELEGLAKTLFPHAFQLRSEEHTSELQSRPHLVCRLLLEK